MRYGFVISEFDIDAVIKEEGSEVTAFFGEGDVDEEIRAPLAYDRKGNVVFLETEGRPEIRHNQYIELGGVPYLTRFKRKSR